MIKAKWKHAWDRELLIRRGADDWLRKCDEYRLWKLIRASEKSALAWDTLELICEELAYNGEERPNTLLHWAFDVVSGRIKRPDEDPVPLGRPPKVGYKLRDNEIRHTVDLLVLVGMSKTAACEAVEEACWDLEGSLDFITISRIYREPYWTIADLEDNVRKLLEPSYHEYCHTHEAEAQFIKDMLAEFIAAPGDTPDEPPLDPLPSSQARFDRNCGRRILLGGSTSEVGAERSNSMRCAGLCRGNKDKRHVYSPVEDLRRSLRLGADAPWMGLGSTPGSLFRLSRKQSRSARN